MRESVILKVTGMKCGGCEANVTHKLNDIDGVVYIKASSQEQQVQVDFNAEKTTLAAIKDAITNAGYTVVSL
ncbi:heavy-metal-associated domain-containing protein [Methylovulum psychrotolerans]|uniref:Copper chaperone n=1 Tax=Methylovulum psychrotolerans TaxID=1704499 RepID=A0A1Z4C5F1_9GAMM|nr:heavy-metal-associated domain-containing protein [Methylovulum psychrotolerans]ASF48718.1 mercuric reductase [Methylovulum psychrotolerans]MBT9097629.1 heavy-metal-associated domain-containing protein [Methylovulum psychrotolerans]POZ53411.1 copper chaperone [Methylovulum psychrotolerans]